MICYYGSGCGTVGCDPLRQPFQARKAEANMLLNRETQSLSGHGCGGSSTQGGEPQHVFLKPRTQLEHKYFYESYRNMSVILRGISSTIIKREQKMHEPTWWDPFW